ncbi:unnamed protein product, partial [marine sediment metagenome]
RPEFALGVSGVRYRRMMGLTMAERQFVIAAALDVPPLAVLFPGLPDADTEKLPG